MLQCLARCLLSSTRYSEMPCPSQALQSRNLDCVYALIMGVQLIAYVLVTLNKVLETSGREMMPALVYFTLCTAPAWACLRSRGGEQAVRRSRTLMLSNIAMSLFLVLWGLDMIPFPTAFMPVSWRGLSSVVIPLILRALTSLKL